MRYLHTFNSVLDCNRTVYNIRKLTAWILVLSLLISGFSGLSVCNSHAEGSVFLFDGSNASNYNGQSIIEFSISNIEESNEAVQILKDRIENPTANGITTPQTELTFVFKKNVTVIGKNVFQNLYNLKCVDFSQATNLKIIEDNAFNNCTNLCQSVYKVGTQYITTAADQNTLWLPSGLSYFGEACFMDTLFTQFEISSDNTSFQSKDGVLFNKAGDTLIAFPSNKNVNASYDIPETVSIIYQYAFEGAGITSIFIPATVKTIGTRAFYNSMLKVVNFAENADVSMGAGAFYQDPTNMTFANTGYTKWNGISQVYISDATYKSSSNYIAASNETACFTPYIKSENSSYGYALGCDMLVVPDVRVSGVPVNWTSCANLNFYWENTDYYTIAELYLDGNVKVPFDVGTSASNPVAVKENGNYTLSIKYKNKNGSDATTFKQIKIEKVDSTAPADVTYTMVDDVCYLHTYDTDSGLDQIKYILNNGDVTNYAESGFTLQPGENKVSTWATDNVGNASKTMEYTISVPNTNRTISLNYASKQLTKGQTFNLKATFHPSTISNKNITWTSSDGSIATVSSSGVVTGERVGYAVITATSNAGYTAKCAVVVTKDPTVKKEITLYKSNTYKLTIKNKRSDYDITYASDDTSICTVTSAGKIKAKKIGEATVITTIDTGVRVYKLKTVVTVSKPSVSITTKPKYVKVDQSYKFKAYRKGLTASIKWSSSKPSVATINKTTGKIIGQSKGKTVITATCGNYKSKYTLTIK